MGKKLYRVSFVCELFVPEDRVGEAMDTIEEDIEAAFQNGEIRAFTEISLAPPDAEESFPDEEETEAW